MSSAILVPASGLTVAAAHGPLGPVLAGLEPDSLAAIAGWSESGASVYTFGNFPGVGFTGSEHVWDAGVAALVCVPLTRSDGNSGFLLVADGEPKRPTTEDVQVLELFAAQVASSLQAGRAFIELRRQASLDMLTGLGHNAAFHARLEDARWDARAGRDHDEGIAVLLIDLDSFKRINDTSGHLAGDRVLTGIAEALAATVRDSDLVFRIGGDEFAVVMPVSTPEEALVIAERLRRVVADDGHTTVSIGVAFFDADEVHHAPADSLRADADLALYEAKRLGRNRVQLFHVGLRNVVLDRARTAVQLGAGLERGQLFLVYQPVVDLVTARILGAEALLRWNHPERGLISPLEFIPIAEEDGQIHAIGAWVLREAALAAAAWNRWPGDDIKVGINVSGAQLDPGFVQVVRTVLSETGVLPDHLVIERSLTSRPRWSYRLSRKVLKRPLRLRG